MPLGGAKSTLKHATNLSGYPSQGRRQALPQGAKGIFPLLLGCFCSFSVGLFRFFSRSLLGRSRFSCLSLLRRSGLLRGPRLRVSGLLCCPGLRINLPQCGCCLSIQRSLSLAFAGGGCLLGGGCFRVSLFLRCRLDFCCQSVPGSLQSAICTLSLRSQGLGSFISFIAVWTGDCGLVGLTEACILTF